MLQSYVNYKTGFTAVSHGLCCGLSRTSHVEIMSKKSKSLTVSRPQLLTGGDDDSFRKFIHEMIAYSARIQEIRKLFGEYVGLTGVQYTILISISQMEEIADVGVNAVADHLHLSGAFVTTEVNKLAKLKLVTK